MIHEVNLSDPTDEAYPPETVLNLSTVGDLAFVAICGYRDGNPATTTTIKHEITVSLPALRQLANHAKYATGGTKALLDQELARRAGRLA